MEMIGINKEVRMNRADLVREAVGIFGSADTFWAAIDELLRSGFDRAELSVLPSEKAVEAKIGQCLLDVAALEDDVTVLRSCYVSPGAIDVASAVSYQIGLVWHESDAGVRHFDDVKYKT